MKAIQRFSALLLACLVSSSLAHAQGGGSPTSTGPIPVPVGATAYQYEIYDYDPTFVDPDELLEKGEAKLPEPIPPFGTVDIDFKDLFCEDGVVKGPNGTSGEAEAEIYVVITFIQPHGTATVTTKVHVVKCGDLPKKSA